MVYTPKIEMDGQGQYSKVMGKTDNKIVKKCYVVLSVLASIFGGNNPTLPPDVKVSFIIRIST